MKTSSPAHTHKLKKWNWKRAKTRNEQNDMQQKEWTQKQNTSWCIYALHARNANSCSGNIILHSAGEYIVIEHIVIFIIRMFYSKVESCTSCLELNKRFIGWRFVLNNDIRWMFVRFFFSLAPQEWEIFAFCKKCMAEKWLRRERARLWHKWH